MNITLMSLDRGPLPDTVSHDNTALSEGYYESGVKMEPHHSRKEKFRRAARITFLWSTVVSLVTTGIMIRTLRLSDDPAAREQIRHILGLARPVFKSAKPVKIVVQEPVYSNEDKESPLIESGSIAYGYVIDAESPSRADAGKLYLQLSSIRIEHPTHEQLAGQPGE